MRLLVGTSAFFFLLTLVCVSCQSSPTFPSSTPIPSATQVSTQTSTPVDETPTAIAATPPHTQVPSPTVSTLTDSEAITMVEEEVTARGVAPSSLRINLHQEPRQVSIRYSSPYPVDSSLFQAQTVLIPLSAARVLVRIQPPLDGGIRVAVIPGGETEVGLRVTLIEGSILETWADGSITDQEFVGQWVMGTVPLE